LTFGTNHLFDAVAAILVFAGIMHHKKRGVKGTGAAELLSGPTGNGLGHGARAGEMGNNKNCRTANLVVLGRAAVWVAVELIAIETRDTGVVFPELCGNQYRKMQSNVMRLSSMSRRSVSGASQAIPTSR
jgi:hypothetical protein